MSTTNTNIVKHTLETFAEEFIIDVPSEWRDGEQFVAVSVLEDHVRALSYNDLVDIMFEVEARYGE